MATRQFEEGPGTRRFSADDDNERWPRSGEVGEHDRPWQYPGDSWSSHRGMFGMGGASRAYNAGGHNRGVYERGYEMRSYDALLDASERRGQPLGKAPKGYQRSDERLREDICERLMESPLDASEVEVKVQDGEVTLEGTVRSRNEKRAIEDVAGSVRGVHDVHNRIRVNAQQAARAEEGGGSDRPLHS
jgi:hypothetical protein